MANQKLETRLTKLEHDMIPSDGFGKVHRVVLSSEENIDEEVAKVKASLDFDEKDIIITRIIISPADFGPDHPRFREPGSEEENAAILRQQAERAERRAGR